MSPGTRNSVVWSLLIAGAFAVEAPAAILPADLAARMARSEPLLIIDARPAIAFEAGHVPGAINIPLGLLPLKPIPTSQLVIVYGDGLGLVDDAKALAVLNAKPGIRAEILAGGYAAWLGDTRLTTAPTGVAPEKLPGITYEQLVAAAKGDMVLIDLRGSGTPTIAASGTPAKAALSAVAATEPDILQQFASKIGVPLVTSSGKVAVAANRAAGPANQPARAAAPPTTGTAPGQLMVLVADNESAANEAARQLRASGQYRFTILIGGTDAIRHEGRVGLGRMDGGLPATKP